MRFSRVSILFFYSVCFYCCCFPDAIIWLFSKNTEAEIVGFGTMDSGDDRQIINTVNLQYKTGVGKIYTDWHARDGLKGNEVSMSIQYSLLFPGLNRVNSFSGKWLPSLIVYIVYYISKTMVFFVPNDTMPRNVFLS